MSIVQKLPISLRLLNIVFGILTTFLAFYIAINYEIALLSILIFFIAVLLFSGFIRFMNGLFDKSKTTRIRYINIVIGSIIFLLGIYIFTIDPIIGVELIIFILMLALFFTGSTRILIGIIDRMFPFWARLVLILIGFFSVLISFFIFISPTIDIEILVLALALGFFFNGIGRILTGLTGWAERD